MMYSRPLVAASLGGALAGDVGHGLVVGVVLELLALETLPVGASRYPEWGSASVAAGALAAEFSARSAAALPMAALVGLVTALGGGWTMIQLRRLNAHWAHRRAPGLDRGSYRTVVGLQLYGLVADLARGAAVALLALLVARPAITAAAGAWSLGDRSSRAVVVAGAATVAIAALWKRADGAADARWYLAGGLALGGLLLWLR
jgi:PTS system mannose-specific IIC component